MADGSGRAVWAGVRVAGATAAVLLGLAMVGLAFALGSCDAFAGRCDGAGPSLLEDDAFGTAATGAALAVGVPVALFVRPRRRLVAALAGAAVLALLVGLLAHAGTD